MFEKLVCRFAVNIYTLIFYEVGSACIGDRIDSCV